MSAKKAYVKEDYGFVGWRGQSVRLGAGDEYEPDDPLVQDMRDRFVVTTPEAWARRSRRG